MLAENATCKNHEGVIATAVHPRVLYPQSVADARANLQAARYPYLDHANRLLENVMRYSTPTLCTRLFWVRAIDRSCPGLAASERESPLNALY